MTSSKPSQTPTSPERPKEPAKPRSKWRRRLGGVVLLIALIAVGFIGLGWQAFGKGAQGERLERMKKSKRWAGSGFENPQPLWNDIAGSIFSMFDGSDYASPKSAVPIVIPDPKLFKLPPENGLRVTWLGHSTVLIELDGATFLTDPIWGERTSPYTFMGPKRWYKPLIPLEDLPKLDAVLISHDHYDHLDMPTILQMLKMKVPFVVPLGVGAHLEYWGVPKSRILEVDWWDRLQIGTVEVVCTPARHASGRQVFDQNNTLWAGYALLGPKGRVYFSGDTGMFPDLAKIGKELGPFDITMVEVGAYNRAWPDWHMGPEQAVEAHKMLRGKHFLPIHWGLFDLALHGWTEPMERVMVAAKKADLFVVTPKPGESYVPGVTKTSPHWWPKLPWETAAEHPIKARGIKMP